MFFQNLLRPYIFTNYDLKGLLQTLTSQLIIGCAALIMCTFIDNQILVTFVLCGYRFFVSVFYVSSKNIKKLKLKYLNCSIHSNLSKKNNIENI